MKEPVVEVAAVLEDKGKILLLQRELEPYAGKWCLPSGLVWWSETADHAARRCVEEQTGLYCELSFFQYADEILLHADWHAVVLCFTGDFSGEISLNEHFTKAEWFTREQISRMHLGFSHQDIIAAYFKRKSLQKS